MEKQITVKNIRMNNKKNILREIVINNGITRNELAKLTNVSLMTITNIVDELLFSGLVYEQKSTSSIGRIPSQLFLSDNSYGALIIDLTSVNSLKFILYNLKSIVIYEDSININKSIDYSANITNLCNIILKIISKINVNLIGLGINIPGIYDKDNDIVRTVLVEGLNNFKPKEIFNKYFNLDNVVIEHDVKAACIAEYAALKDAKSLFYFYVGDGIGGSFISSGNLLEGVSSTACEIGQLIEENGLTMENNLSLIALENNLPLNLSDYSLLDIFKVYVYEENADITTYVNNILDSYSRTIMNMLWCYNPEYLIINSACKHLPSLLMEYAEKYIAERTKSIQGVDLKYTLKVSSYGLNSALIGLKNEVIHHWIDSII